MLTVTACRGCAQRDFRSTVTPIKSGGSKISGALADALALITAIAIAVLVAAVRARWGLDSPSLPPLIKPGPASADAAVRGCHTRSIGGRGGAWNDVECTARRRRERRFIGVLTQPSKH